MNEIFTNKGGDQYKFCKEKPNPSSSHVIIQGCWVSDKEKLDMFNTGWPFKIKGISSRVELARPKTKLSAGESTVLFCFVLILFYF